MLRQAAGLFKDGMSVRGVASELRISKTEAGRMRLRLVADGLPLPRDRELGGIVMDA